MNSAYVSAFNLMQDMRRDDIEVYHYIDAAPCDVSLHSHDFYEFYCLLDGSMDYLVEGCRYTLKPGTLLLIAPGELHRPDVAAPPRDFDRIVLWLNPRFVSSLSDVLPQVLRAFDRRPFGWHLITPDEKTYQIVLNLLYALLYEKERADADSLYQAHLILSQLLIHLSRLLGRQSAVPGRLGSRYGEIMRVYQYINAHYQEAVTVSGLAEQFYMDKNTLTRQFKRIIGLTPGDYIRRKRLEEAHALIQRGSGILEAGYRCGFMDYSAFYRAFRQLYGIAPSDFAAQARLEPQESHAPKREE